MIMSSRRGRGTEESVNVALRDVWVKREAAPQKVVGVLNLSTRIAEIFWHIPPTFISDLLMTYPQSGATPQKVETILRDF